MPNPLLTHTSRHFLAHRFNTRMTRCSAMFTVRFVTGFFPSVGFSFDLMFGAKASSSIWVIGMSLMKGAS